MGAFCDGCQTPTKGKIVALERGWRVFVCPLCGTLNVKKYDEKSGEQLMTRHITPLSRE
jgi:predicted RNA-binding Zn-ribbon protein involved in translation (DUF1610 family)